MKTIEIKEGFLCDVCQNSRKALFYTTVRGVDEKEYSLVQCEKCGMVSVFPSPTTEFLDAFYSKNYKGKVKEGIVESRNIEANRAAIEDGFTKLRYIEKYGNITTGKLLDVGCGHGFFLYAAKELGYQPLGIDIDSEAIHYGHSVLRVKILEQNIDMLAKLPADSFDLITFWQVLEHLRRPGSCVRAAHTLLRGGVLLQDRYPISVELALNCKGENGI